MTHNFFIRLITLLAWIVLSANAFACSTAAWSVTSGLVSVEDPANGIPGDGIPSVSGSCGFEVTGAGYVQDNSPDAENQFIGRFYFFPELSGDGSTDIFIAYSDEASTELFSVTYNGSNLIIDATSASGGSASVPVSGTGWHLIEFSWVSGAFGKLWVDADATQDTENATFDSGSGAVETVRLGAPNDFGGLSGRILFDDYVSQRTSAIGGILAGDGNLDGIFDLVDIEAIKSQFLFDTYSEGSTDCNLDGGTNSGDVDCVAENL